MTQDLDALRGIEGCIFSLDQTATHDGPGVRMMVYLKGCPLRCLWCHSPESIDPQPEVVWYESRCRHCGRCVKACPEGLWGIGPWEAGAAEPAAGRCRLCGRCVEACEQGALEIKGYVTTAGRLADEAVRLKPFFRRSGGGVTLSGGEPMLQPRFAYAVAALCRAAGIHVALETAGHVRWARLEAMAQVVDLFLYDLKEADAARHHEFTGASNRLVLANLRRLVAAGADVIVRVPLVPGYNDSPDAVRAIAGAARRAGVSHMTLLPFNPAAPGKWSWLRRPYPIEGAARQSAEEVGALEELARSEGLAVVPP
jgi:pyruvate formate lyase activating enzyme